MYTARDDAAYLAGLAQTKETDVFVGNLIQKLEEYELKGTSDSNLLRNTPFFIWSKDTETEKITKVTNTADILPTLANMFGLDID